MSHIAGCPAALSPQLTCACNTIAAMPAKKPSSFKRRASEAKRQRDLGWKIPRMAGAEMFYKIWEKLNSIMRFSILGEVATTEEVSAGLGSTVAEQHGITADMRTKYDAARLDFCMQRLTNTISRWNFPGDPPPTTVTQATPVPAQSAPTQPLASTEDQERALVNAWNLTNAVGCAVRVKDRHFAARMG